MKKSEDPEFLAIYEGYRDRAVHNLEALLAQYEGPDSLKEVLKYALLGSGKLFRPVLVAAISDLFSIHEDQIKEIQVAVEFVHASSLMHDDLPALDNDDFRRGKPSTHKVFGEGLALLGGDFLLAKASKMLLESKLDPFVKVQIAQELSHAISEMCEGQVMDLEIRKQQDTNTFSNNELLYDLEKINLKKTGALIRFSLIAPLYLIEVPRESFLAIESYAKNISILFQLCDDLLDSKHDTKEGEYREINYVDVLGEEEARKYASSLAQNTIDILDSIPTQAKFLKSLVKFVLSQR